MLNAQAIPASLRAIPQWVVWRYEERGGKQTKVPYRADSKGYASSTNPDTWDSFEAANAALDARYNGIGLVLTDDLGIVGVDLDHVSDWLDDAERIIGALDSYTEITPSGDGYRVFVQATLPDGRRRKGPVEMYCTGRFLTVTGNAVSSTGFVEERQDALNAIHTEFVADAPREATVTPRSQGVVNNIADAELIARAKSANNGEKFTRLWQGELAEHGGDHSAADLALMSELAFWTGGDQARMDALFRQSGLMRDKYELRDDYRQWTLDRACQRSDFYTPTVSVTLAPQGPGRGQILTETGQRRLAQQQASQVQVTGLTVSGEDEAGHGVALTGRGTANRSAARVEDDEVHPSQPYSNTDLGNAQRLAARHGGELRFCHAWGKWLVWDGHRWQVDDTGAVMRRAADTARSILIEAANAPTAEVAQALSKWANASMNVNRLKAMVDLARSLDGIPVTTDELDRDHWKINFLNGTLSVKGDYDEPYFYPNNPTDLITKVIPYDYVPGAQSPRWEQFLLDAMQGSADLCTFLQHSVGYSLTGAVSERCLWVLHGVGRNGKSTFVETLTELLGDYAMNTPTTTLMSKQNDGGVPNDVARLVGARFVTAAETGDGKRLDESGIKALTGGDTMTARFMRGEFFSFKPSAKLWLSTNHKPQIRGTDKGIWDRIRLVPFARRLEDHEQDRDLGKKLMLEAEGILAWAVRGCMAWMRDGLTMPAEVSEATSSYREEMDSLGAFLADRCVLDPNGKVPSRQLYHAYREWTEAAGEWTLSDRRFGMQLRERGFESYKENAVRGWRGINLINQGLELVRPAYTPIPAYQQPAGLPWGAPMEAS